MLADDFQFVGQAPDSPTVGRSSPGIEGLRILVLGMQDQQVGQFHKEPQA